MVQKHENVRQYGDLLSLIFSPNEKRHRKERGKTLLTLHNLSQFVTSFVLAGTKSPVQPAFLSDLREDPDALQRPNGRKKFQKLEISASQQMQKQLITRIPCT
jgi:hypothetical protein